MEDKKNIFFEEFNKVLHDKNISEEFTPNTLIEVWDDFIEQCIDGFQYSLYDFDYEITIRDDIQVILDSSSLKKYTEYERFSKEINILDNKLKDIIIMKSNTPHKWWKDCILKYSGSQYAENVKKELNIIVPVIED